MTARAISTVLDVALCLLLVSAAVLLVVQAPVDRSSTPHDTADRTLTIVGTSTAQVNYSLTPDPAAGVPTGDALDRTAHGTLASLLADAAVGTVTLHGERLTRTGDGFETAVDDATRETVAQRSVRVQVTARWEPYRGAPVRGRVAVGPDPPRSTDVHLATMTVPSGMESRSATAHAAADEDGFDGVARVVARDIVRGLYPPNRTADALRAGGAVRALAERRYRRGVGLYGGDVSEPLADGDVERANERLAAAMRPAIARDLRDHFETPRGAARAVSVGAVRVTVRTWSA